MLSKSSKRTFSKKKKIETEQEERKTRSQLKKFSLNKLGNPETGFFSLMKYKTIIYT